MLTWTRPDRGLNVCPHLSMVKFWGCHSSSDGVLADMIESRWKTRDGGPAKSLSIAFLMLKNSTNSEDFQRLDLLNEERIGISIVKL